MQKAARVSPKHGRGRVTVRAEGILEGVGVAAGVSEGKGYLHNADLDDLADFGEEHGACASACGKNGNDEVRDGEQERSHKNGTRCCFSKPSRSNDDGKAFLCFLSAQIHKVRRVHLRRVQVSRCITLELSGDA